MASDGQTANGEAPQLAGGIAAPQNGTSTALQPVPMTSSAYTHMGQPVLRPVPTRPTAIPGSFPFNIVKPALPVKPEPSIGAPQPPEGMPLNGMGMPVIRGRPFASAARASIVARKQADMAAMAASEARILGIDDAPAEVIRYADDAQKWAELSEQAAVTTEGIHQAGKQCASSARDSEFRNRATVVARQATEYREKAAKALIAAAHAAGVTLRHRARRPKRKQQPEQVEDSSQEEEQEDDGGLLALALAGSRESTPPRDFTPPRAFTARKGRSCARSLEQLLPSQSDSQQSADAGSRGEAELPQESLHPGARSAEVAARQHAPHGTASAYVGVLPDPEKPQRAQGDAWSAVHEELWTAVLDRFGGSCPSKNPAMVVVSRLVLEAWTTAEAATCLRSIAALDRVEPSGDALSYLRRRMFAAASSKGYMAFS